VSGRGLLMLLPVRNFEANGAATPATEAELTSPKAAATSPEDTMKLTRLAGALATVALLAGCGLTHHTAAPAPRTAARPHPAPVRALAAGPSLAWLDSAGGQAQVTFNQDVDTLAGALVIENDATTIANHLIFEADARTVRTEARTILADPALLPDTGRAAYRTMLDDFITVANMLQPGAGYGTTAQDYTAWYTALRATDITVS
jgi:hypothetical protein